MIKKKLKYHAKSSVFKNLDNLQYLDKNNNSFSNPAVQNFEK